MTNERLTADELRASVEEATDACAAGNPMPFIERFLWVQDEGSGMPVAMTALEPQRYYHRESFGRLPGYEAELYAHIVKARSAYSSRWWHACNFAFRCCLPGFKSVIVLNSDKNLREFLEADDVFYNNLPEGMAPEKDHWDTEFRSFIFRGGLQVTSSVAFASVRSKEFMRGGRPKMVHYSESAHYEPGYADALNQSLGKSLAPHAWVIEESTPNGMENRFYARFEALRQGAIPGVSLFRAWYNISKYRVGEEEAVAEDRGEFRLMEEEERLSQLFAVDGVPVRDRIRWRRARLRAEIVDAYGDEQRAKGRFLAEYPENTEDCWYDQGAAGALPADRLRELLHGCRAPLEERIVIPGVRLLIWERPAAGGVYVAGHDPADLGGDLNCLQVLEARTGVHVAMLVGQANVTQFTVEACKVGLWYNEALLGIEVDAMGKSAAETARSLCKYPRLYYERPPGPNRPAVAGVSARGHVEEFHEALWQGLFNGGLVTYSRDVIRDLMGYNPSKDHTPDRVRALQIAEWLRGRRRTVGMLESRRSPMVLVPVSGGRYGRSIW